MKNEYKFLDFFTGALIGFVLVLYLLFIFSACRTIRTSEQKKTDSTAQNTRLQKLTHVKKSAYIDSSQKIMIDTSESITYHFARPVRIKNLREIDETLQDDSVQIIKVEIKKARINTIKKRKIHAIIRDTLKQYDSVQSAVNYTKNESLTTHKKANNTWAWWLIIIVVLVGVGAFLIYKYRGAITSWVVKKII